MCSRSAAACRDARWRAACRALAATQRSATTTPALRKTIFGDQIRGRLAKGLGDRTGAYSEDKDGTLRATYHSGVGADAILELDPSTISGASWANDRRVLLRVDDEYISARPKVDPQPPPIQVRDQALPEDVGPRAWRAPCPRECALYRNVGGKFVLYQHCGGCQVDHICPMACFGLDAPQDMQWLTAEANRAKSDDCSACGLTSR